MKTSEINQKSSCFFFFLYFLVCQNLGLDPLKNNSHLHFYQDDEEFEDDYESPFSGDEEGSVGDYESPNEEVDGNDYEPPPSEPPEDLPHKLCPPLPPGDDDYIGNHIRCPENYLLYWKIIYSIILLLYYIGKL